MTSREEIINNALRKYATRKVYQRKILLETVTDKEVDAEIMNITKNRNISYETGNIMIYDSDWHLEMILDQRGERIDSPIFSRKRFQELRRTIKEDKDYLTKR